MPHSPPGTVRVVSSSLMGVLISLNLLAGSPEAGTWFRKSFHERVQGYCFIGMVRIDGLRAGTDATHPDSATVFGTLPTTDTLSGTVTGILKNSCEAGAKIGDRAVFIRPKEPGPGYNAAADLKPGDSALVLSEYRIRSLATPDVKSIEYARQRPIIQIMLRHQEVYPDKAADLAHDMGYFDYEITASAMHELEKMGPKGSAAIAPLRALLKSPAAANRLEGILTAIRFVLPDKAAFRPILESVLDSADLSQNKGLLYEWARMGPAAIPRLSRVADSHPDEWVRFSAIAHLCIEEIKGPAAKALAERKSREDASELVRRKSKRVLNECYGGPPLD
jgi:hypothetical protein